jgi:hypothetical protein
MRDAPWISPDHIGGENLYFGLKLPVLSILDAPVFHSVHTKIMHSVPCGHVLCDERELYGH